jgi:hypothetical protein
MKFREGISKWVIVQGDLVKFLKKKKKKKKAL